MGKGVLEQVLGGSCGGIISCDFFGAYRKFERMTGSLPQFCRAHCIREVLFLLKPEDAGVRRYGRRLIKQIGLMCERIRRKGEIQESKWKGLMNEHRELIERWTLPHSVDTVKRHALS